MNEYNVFALTWATLIFAPPIALGLFLLLRRHYDIHLILKMLSGCVAVVVFIIACLHTRFSFKSTLANFSCLAACYCAFCFIAASCLSIPIKILRFLALAATAFPIGIGYVLGTIGALGLAFIVGDYTRQPEHIEEMRPGLICRITFWGMAASDSGYAVHLYKQWNAFPLFEREVAVASVNQTAGQANKSCADVLAAL